MCATTYDATVNNVIEIVQTITSSLVDPKKEYHQNYANIFVLYNMAYRLEKSGSGLKYEDVNFTDIFK